jgi:hypothetical protein
MLDIVPAAERSPVDGTAQLGIAPDSIAETA